MQFMVSHTQPLPPCRNGHAARHIHDTRCHERGGGHQVECRCSRTNRHAEYDDALREWCITQGHPAPVLCAQRPLPLGITPMRMPA